MAEGHIYTSIREGIARVKKGFFYVACRGVLYPFWVHVRSPGSIDALTIFFPGSTRRGKPLPIFQRQSYADELNCDVICVADPALHFDEDITMAWFAGDRIHHHADVVGQLLRDYVAVKKYSRILSYGTSAGGIPAICATARLAQYDAIACIGNAQLNIFDYYPNHFRKLINTSFMKMEVKAFSEKYGNRINMIGRPISFPLICMQNVADNHHYVNHFLPFIEGVHSGAPGSIFIEYEDPELGHEPLPKAIELELISNILNGSGLNTSIIPNSRRVGFSPADR